MENNEKVLLETERFRIRELELTDVDGMYKLDSNPNVHKYLGNNPIKTKDEALKMIEFIRKQYIDNGIGRWAIIDKKTNEFIGWTGMKWITEETNGRKNFYDIGYRLIEENWGKGIATETAKACLKYGFENLKTDKIFAIADRFNEGSNKILKKLGMRLTETYFDNGMELNWYEISKNDVLV